MKRLPVNLEFLLQLQAVVRTSITPTFERSLVWLRRDLRLDDNRSLAAALEHSRSLAIVFVFDTDILGALTERRDRRVEFIHQSIAELSKRLTELGGRLLVAHGCARTEIARLARALDVQAVFASRDYEPLACARDDAVGRALREDGRTLELSRDTVIFERNEIVSAAGTPYTVFTPYRNAWLRELHSERHAPGLDAGGLRGRLFDVDATVASGFALPSLEALGFQPSGLETLGIQGGAAEAQRRFEEFTTRIDRYHETRDFPAVKGPSYLSVHLRFGTISIRQLVRYATELIAAEPARADGARVWLSELIWREFYFQVLHHHPHVVSQNFRPQFDRVIWNDDPQGLQAWQEGRTGFPIVDAAMRQLNRTGYMHNRLRMIVASFLTKDLGIDWRQGEAYFAARLIDYDLAANNGGWQWAASTGCDAQPWFRIFNPLTQSLRFDPKGKFIRKYLPELAQLDDQRIHAPWQERPARSGASSSPVVADYPAPIVDHAIAREQTLKRFAVVRDR